LDSFGNLFITYLDIAVKNVVTLLSTDGGQTFTQLAMFGPATVDQPTVTANAGAVWLAWNQSGYMVARGAPVTDLGNVGDFSALQQIPGTKHCSYGDIAIAPNGTVVQVCESPDSGPGPASLLVNIKPAGSATFGPAMMVTTTNVGGVYFVPPQRKRGIDAEAGLGL
jgi:hypothetical protein